MRIWDRLRLRVRTVVRRGAVERELEEEMAFHVAMQAAAHRRAGADGETARRAAWRDLGGVMAMREGCRAAWGSGWIDGVVRDLRLALRTLGRSPGLVATCLLSLGLGIGANAAMFSLVDALLLRPLPLPAAERLLALGELRAGEPVNGNPLRLDDWRTQVAGLSAVAGTYGEELVLGGEAEPRRLAVLRTVGDLEAVLAVHPALGRGFSAAERRGLGAPVVLLGDRLWRQRYGARRTALGQTLVLGGTACSVVGVLPAAVAAPLPCDLWAPAPRSVQESGRKAAFLTLVARLAPGATPARVEAQLGTVAARLARQYPDSDGGLAAHVTPLAEDLVRGGRTPLRVLAAVVGLVLLIACANVATLLLARAAGRRREAAIRLALGGGRASLVRTFASESVLLALGGGTLGLLAAGAGVALLRAFLPADLPRLASAAVDWRVALFALAVSLTAGVGAGLAPAWRALPAGPGEALKEGAAAASGVRREWLPRALVVGEVTLALALVVAAALVAQSFVALRQAPLGLRPAGVVTCEVDLPWDTPAAVLHARQAAILARFAQLPGVSAAGLIDRLPLLGGTQSSRIVIRGRPAPAGRELEAVSLRAASPGTFAALGIPLLAGRTLAAARPGAARTVVVNATLARRWFGDAAGGTAAGVGSAVGAFLAFDRSGGPAKAPPAWYEIVGVVGDVRQVATEPVAAEAYVLAEHTYWPLSRFVLRVAASPPALAAALRGEVRRIDPNLVVDDIAPLGRQLDATRTAPRFRMWVLAGFALLGLLLAAVGIHGVLAQEVSGRSQEIGVRMALGAGRRSVLWLALRRGLLLAGAGLLLGTGLALAAGRLLGSLLYGVAAADVPTYLLAGLLLLAVAAAASLMPACRAARVDPNVALRRGG